MNVLTKPLRRVLDRQSGADDGSEATEDTGGRHFRRVPTSGPAGPSPARAGSRRALLTLTDQGFSSVSNFAVAVAVARGAGASGLGGFSVAYSGWLVLAAMHRSLITDPMAIEGDVRSTEVGNAIRRGFAAEVLLGLAGAAAFVLVGGTLALANQGTFGFALLVLAPWLPFLLVQDYWRWIGFMTRRPGMALANDTVFNVFQATAFAAVFVFGVHNEAALIGSWGLGAAVGVLYGLHQFRVRPSFRGGWSLLRARWTISKWIAGSSLTNWGASQMYVFIAAILLGPAGLGGLKAAQTLVSGPSGVLIQAGGSIGLPEASRSYADQGWKGLVRVARIIAVAGILSFIGAAVVVALWGKTLLSHVYGPAFGHMALVALLFAIAYIFQGFALGPILVIKATRQTHWLFVVQAISLAVSVVSMISLCLVLGTTGAALAMVITYAVYAVAYRSCQHRVRKVISPSDLASSATVTLDDLDELDELDGEVTSGDGGPAALSGDVRRVLHVPQEAGL
ncbi:MAG TPA: oligosaccharide flippase family protein [Acidimicrobiales bacterium]|nr:oligosaccharide flippase family protein [Acidimicrobiales bacterium]